MTKIPSHYVALSEYLTRHLEVESGALAAYEDAIRGRETDVVTYLVTLILADERRHHELFAEMKNSLESAISWRNIEPRVPGARVEPVGIAELLERTTELLELEREDAKSLQRLRRHWAQKGEERKLWSLLVQTAEYDTKKHIAILEYLQARLRDASSS